MTETRRSLTPRSLAPDELLAEITLTMIPRVGSLTIKRLFERFAEADMILSAPASELQTVEGVGPTVADRIANARNRYNPHEIVDLCRQEGIDILSIRDSRYPELLRMIHDPPQILYVRGSLTPADAISIAVAGTRRMTPYGKRQTARLSAALVQYGITVVSGLAKGIDATAHKAALDSGGRTIAVLGSGLLRLYPQENIGLADDIVRRQQGAIISEYAPWTEPFRGNFPQRNRITSGLAIGTLIVEAPRQSGALITARLAHEQGREVFAVPGPIDSEQSRGTLKLISDGAVLTESVDDILNTLGPLWKPTLRPNNPNLPNDSSDTNGTSDSDGQSDGQSVLRHPKELQLNTIETLVLQSLSTTGSCMEQIAEQSQLQQHQIETALSVLWKQRLIGETDDSSETKRFKRL